MSRAEGRSSVAAAAYRSGECLTDERTGEISDYRRKGGVAAGDVVLPGGETMPRSQLWNAVEAKHKRGDALVAREFELALPHELSAEQRAGLVGVYARELADKYGVAVDWNIHSPGGEELNHHAHVMLTACYCTPDGTMGKKAVELDPIHCARAKILNPMEVQRARWQDLCNAALARAGQQARIDHRTLEAQGIERAPGVHLGPAAHAIVERGESSHIAERARVQADEFMARVQAQAAIEQAQKRVEQLQAEMAEMEREEDDGIRIQALERIGSNVTAASRTGRATDRACRFAVDDHAGTDQSLGTAGANLSRVVAALRPPDQHMEAARAAWSSTVRAVRASANDLGNAERDLQAAGPDFGRAVEIARGRQHHCNAGAVAQALGRSLERLVPALAAIPHQVERHLVELATKARQAKKQSEKQIMATKAEAAITLKTLKKDFGVDVTPAQQLSGPELDKWLEKTEDKVFESEFKDFQSSLPSKPAREAVPPAPSLVDQLKASFAKFVEWVSGNSGKCIEVDAQRSDHYGPVVQLDDLHCVQKTGRGLFAIHQLDRLDKLPALDDPKMEIKYRDGVGQVKGKLGQEVER